MTTLRHLVSRLMGRTPDPDVLEARKVLDETRRTTARVSRILIDIDAQGWGKHDRPLDDDQFPDRRHPA